MTVKVSIIIPVYNAGDYIERPINSLLKQSLPQDEFEVLFVDDGSTDDSAERLKKIADESENFRVFSMPNSGWPGRPRNVGVANARGEYIHFLDQDDALGPKALQVMYERARKNNSDIVVGKVKGNMRGPIRLFRESADSVGPEFAELYETLTPHKMFRRQFLLDNAITFQEGRCRLEDQMFLAKAYPLAKNITIVGDVVCYDWSKRDDGSNNSKTRTEPGDYYPWLAKTAQIVKANTSPGPVRDAFLTRNYRVEVLRNTSTGVSSRAIPSAWVTTRRPGRWRSRNTRIPSVRGSRRCGGSAPNCSRRTVSRTCARWPSVTVTPSARSSSAARCAGDGVCWSRRSAPGCATRTVPR